MNISNDPRWHTSGPMPGTKAAIKADWAKRTQAENARLVQLIVDAAKRHDASAN